jgi:hypothetical protein
MTLNQQRDAHQQEIQQLKEENMQLGLEVIYIFLYSLITSFIIIDWLWIESGYINADGNQRYVSVSYNSESYYNFDGYEHQSTRICH